MPPSADVPPPSPKPGLLTDAFARALRDGLRLQHCTSCGLVIYYPRVACPRCLASTLEWRPVSGLGSVASFGVVHRSLHQAFHGQVPFCLAAIQLDEGPVVLALLDGCPAEQVHIGMRVRASRGPDAQTPILRFVPAIS